MMHIWIRVQLHLLGAEVRHRARDLWRARDRGSMATEFAIVAAAIIGIALLVVAVYKAFAEDQASKIGGQ